MSSLIGGVTADDAKKAIERSLAWDIAVIVRLVPEAKSER
jgi:hypothetical protein